MERRSFFKILSTVSAGMAATSCGNKTDMLIPMLVSDREIVPGEEQWHPAVCTECAAGCGTIVRVMEGERVIERNGAKFRERLACIKKIEGNPLDPVSGGRLCARGQAAVQSLYHPDRVKGPLRRTGARGKAEFAQVSWDEAIQTISEKLAQARSKDPSRVLFLTGPQLSTRTLSIQRFLAAIGAPPPLTCSPANFALEQKAAEAVFGWKGIPRYDLAQARYALGIGADFLGGWASPVYYARQYGGFRQGRPGIRGRLVQAESRMSLTSQSADEWLPIRPGSEPHFTIAIAQVLLREKLARNADHLQGTIIDSIQAADLTALTRACGISATRLRRVARELGESEAPLVIAGASVVHTNSLDALVGANYLNWLLGNIGKPGGVFPPQSEPATRSQTGNVIEALKRANVLFLDRENPVYSVPAAAHVSEALLSVPELIVSFGPFLDDSATYADLILPDHHSLESDMAVLPLVSPQPGITVSTPFVQPLYNTRPLAESLNQIARKMNTSFDPETPKALVEPLLVPSQTWNDVARQGGLWRQEELAEVASPKTPQKLEWPDPVFSGDPQKFPLLFQPYLSVQYQDGSAANLPWMQELPDPVSSAMWGLPLEIDPQTAVTLSVNTGDWVRVESTHGSLQAPAYVHPAALPGVVSMAVGQGHVQHGRYASGRGANPLSIVDPAFDSSTGALAFGATRVRVTRLERRPGELIQFSPRDREQGPWGYR